MNKLTNQEIIKVFALYIGCPCAIYDYHNNATEWIPDHIEGVDMIDNKIIAERVNWPIEKVKLIVKPMEIYLTEEDKAHVMLFILDDKTIRSSGSIFQYLLKLNFDVPLFFEVDHWANGKTVFDLELAIPDREYLWELARKTPGFEVEQLPAYASELNLNIDKLPDMLKLIELLEKAK